MSEGTDLPAGPTDIAIARQNTPDFQEHENGGGGRASTEDLRLVAMLRAGDEGAFVSLIERYNNTMLRLAMIYIPERAVAEEIVQEAWVGVLQGTKRFEGRSSLKTWIFRILTNCARTRAQREGRSVPFSSLPDPEVSSDESAVDPDRFLPAGSKNPGGWVSLPSNWSEIPENRLLSQETYACIEMAIGKLPPNQRTVIALHDIEGWGTEEIRNVLSISEVNLRVLLHRARSRVRRALEQYFDEQT
jgi:RNA polymerase sigma-70 factor (ECF subfamily)